MPPSLHGVSWAQFPRFSGSMRHSDSSPPIPPRFVAFAWRYHPSTCGFAPSDARCHVHGLGLGEPVPAPRRSLRWRRRGLPGSRETHTHACHALRPRRGRCIHGHSDATMWPSVQRKTSALATNAFRGSIRGLRTPCERFAPWVTPGPRITRFRLAAALGRMGLDTHRVSNKVSKITSSHLVPLDRASPGTRVVARIVTGPHDAHRQDPHLPMRYDTGRPRAVIRLRISQPRTTSLPCPAGLRARRPAPMMDVSRKNVFSTRP